jgi:hypothetical protein
MVATNRSGGDRVANGEDTFPRDGLPSRPMDLTKDQSQIWSDLMSQLPNEILRRVDSHNLKTMVILLWTRDQLAKVVTGDPQDLRSIAKLVSVSQQINRLSGQYGLSPIDRRRMKLAQVDNSDDADDWSDG